MRPIALISIGVGGTAGLAGTAVAVNYFYGGETIKEQIERTLISKNKILLVEDRADLSDIKEKYEESTDKKRIKPLDSSGKPIDKEKLVKWCAEKVDTKFSNDKDSVYLAILSWCFVNSKTIKEELASRNRELYTWGGETDAKWQEAWTYYQNNKESINLLIEDEDLGKLNDAQTQKEAGGKALQKWCNSMNESKKKLYEDGEEANYELFDQWCSKVKEN